MQGETALCQFRETDRREHRRQARFDGRHSGRSRVRQPRYRGQNRGGAFCSCQQHSVLGHLPRHAVRRYRVRTQRARVRGCQFERDGADDPSGHRPHGGAERHYGQRRHDASGSLSLCVAQRVESGCSLRQAEYFGAPPPPLRVQQRLPRAVRGGRHAGRRRQPRHGTGRGGRGRLASVVRRHPVPSRIQEHRTASVAVVRGVRTGGVESSKETVNG